MSVHFRHTQPDLKAYEKFKEIYVIDGEHGYLLWKYGTDNNAEIEDIFVDDEFRQQWFGTKMVKELVDAIGTKLIFVFTKSDNDTAQKFYTAIGFQKGGELDDNWLYWQKRELIKQTIEKCLPEETN